MSQNSIQALNNALSNNDHILVEKIVQNRIFDGAGASEFRGVSHAGLDDDTLNRVMDCLYHGYPAGRVSRLWYSISDYLMADDAE